MLKAKILYKIVPDFSCKKSNSNAKVNVTRTVFIQSTFYTSWRVCRNFKARVFRSYAFILGQHERNFNQARFAPQWAFICSMLIWLCILQDCPADFEKMALIFFQLSDTLSETRCCPIFNVSKWISMVIWFRLEGIFRGSSKCLVFVWASYLHLSSVYY